MIYNCLCGILKWDPVVLPAPAKVVNVKQYCILGGEEETTQTIQARQQVGIITETMTAFNNPIWSLQESDGTRRMTDDYRKLNKVILDLQLRYQIC